MKVQARVHEKFTSYVIFEYEGQQYKAELLWESKSGVSMLSGDFYYKGIHMAVTPVKYKNGMLLTRVFSGYRKLIMGMDRYSRKTWDRVTNDQLSNVETNEHILDMLTKIQVKEGI